MMYFVGRLVYFSAIGVLFLTLIGPVLGILGTLLPFAIIGALVWGADRGVRRLVVGKGDASPTVVPVEVSNPPLVVSEVREERPRRGWLARTGRVVLEVLSGAVVAGAVAAAFSWGTPAAAETVVTAVLVGGAVGFLVGSPSKPDAANELRPACDVAC